VNAETEEQSSSECTHIRQSSRKSLNKLCLPARKLMAIVFWDTKRVLMVDGGKRDHNNARSVLQNSKKTV
jgi:hypothetical protein